MMPVLEGTERSSVLLEFAVKHDYLSGEWEEKSKDKTGEVTWPRPGKDFELYLQVAERH